MARNWRRNGEIIKVAGIFMKGEMEDNKFQICGAGSFFPQKP
jgi:hypothetical protein